MEVHFSRENHQISSMAAKEAPQAVAGNDDGSKNGLPPSPNQEYKSIIEREQVLRESLQSKPRNALLMARLSDILMQKARASGDNKEGNNLSSSSSSSSSSSYCPWKVEAMNLANQAIEQAPHRPYGYISLSFAAEFLKERLTALERAIEILTQQQQVEIENSNRNIGNQPLSSTYISVAILLARRLIEPRQEEIKQIVRNPDGSSSMARGDARHPSRRDLSPAEIKLYDRLQSALDDEWEHIHCLSTINVVLCLGKYEYRLGTFFRKMEPRQVYQLQSQRHFRRAATELATIYHTLAQEALFWLASMASGNGTNSNESAGGVSRCPPAYIEGLFSTFAKRFDACLLQGLHYQTPTRLRFLVDQVVKTRHQGSSLNLVPSFRRALDLGCGTGLSGMAFRNCVQFMIGVDLSSEMLQLAKDKGCYHELVQADLETYLQQQIETSSSATTSTEDEDDQQDSTKYDLILAADVLVYLGDLRDTLTGVRHFLSDNGLFAGSTEYCSAHTDTNGTTNRSNCGYVLQDSGRFAHTQSYLKSLVEEIGLQLVRLELAPIRKNHGKDVMGMLFLLSKR
jgi:predicted TPR repeat methyltransferase